MTKVSPRLGGGHGRAPVAICWRQKGIKLFAVIDHSGEAQAVGLELRDTKVVIFGSPKAGTPVMQAAPLAALDLPLKVLVWDDGGQTKLTYTPPAALAARYGLSDELAAPARRDRRADRRVVDRSAGSDGAGQRRAATGAAARSSSSARSCATSGESLSVALEQLEAAPIVGQPALPRPRHGGRVRRPGSRSAPRSARGPSRPCRPRTPSARRGPRPRLAAGARPCAPRSRGCACPR